MAASRESQQVKPDVHKLVFGAGRPPHIVIIGAGFAGLEAAKVLVKSGADITLIDKRNYHLFQPLLYQVATATLSGADVAVSIRSLFPKNKNVDILYDEVMSIDIENRFVNTRDNAAQHYDYLIVATGAEYSYFGHQDWPRHAPGLKTLDDAQRLRRDILSAFERAETTQDPVLQKELLTFVLIGGGSTGVEMAGALSELIREGLDDFRHINPALIKIVLIEAGPTLLPGFSEKTRRYTHKILERRGITVLLNSPVLGLQEEGVRIKGGLIPAATVIWCAGVKATPAGKWLKAKTTAAGCVLVEKDLSLPGYPEVFVAGDAAAVQAYRGYLRGLAAVAKQQGGYLGKLITARMHHRSYNESFRYRDSGIMTVIGRGVAAGDFGKVKLTGLSAWFLWGAVHICSLVGFRSRCMFLVHWAWASFRLRRRNWLITGLPMDEYIQAPALRLGYRGSESKQDIHRAV